MEQSILDIASHSNSLNLSRESTGGKKSYSMSDFYYLAIEIREIIEFQSSSVWRLEPFTTDFHQELTSVLFDKARQLESMLKESEFNYK
ncbi:TPA: hypothetical protein ACX6S8_003809 [Photobacterium damselae]